MDKRLLGTIISLLCFFSYGCMSPRLSSLKLSLLEQLSSEQQQSLLEKLHISDLCSYYLNSELQQKTENIIVDLLKGRGVQSCSADGLDKIVADKLRHSY